MDKNFKINFERIDDFFELVSISVEGRFNVKPTHCLLG